MAPKGYEVTLQMIGPKEAEILLKKNKNRKTSEAQIRKYVRSMESGNWHTVNDTIAIRHDGVLINGQHRLNAIVKANRSFLFILSFGHTEADQKAMDEGRKRSLYDVLMIGDIEVTRAEASIARYVRNQTMQEPIPKKASRDEEVEFTKRHYDILRQIGAAIYPSHLPKHARSSLGKIGNDVAAAFFRALSYYHDSHPLRSQVIRFAEALSHGKYESELGALEYGRTSKREKIRSRIFKYFKQDLKERGSLDRQGQDQKGRDHYYRKAERYIRDFVNPPDEMPERSIQPLYSELFLLPEEEEAKAAFDEQVDQGKEPVKRKPPIRQKARKLPKVKVKKS